MANKLLYYYYRIIEEIYKKKNIIRVFWTKVGLKNINMGKAAQLYNPYIIEKVEVNADNLFLGPDFLKDKYSLLGVNIQNSPHYSFMKALHDGENIEETDYVRRWLSGTLDWRRKMPLGRQVERWKSMYEQRIYEIENDRVADVLVYNVSGRYFIYDGKHKAALSALMGKKIKCSVISETCVFSYYSRYMLDLVSERREYSKHMQFLNEYIRKSKGNL